MKKKYFTLIYLIIIMIYSIYNLYNAKIMLLSYSNYYIKELIWFILGFIIIFLSTKINIDIILKNSKYLYILGIIMLICVHFFGININGSTSWIKIGKISIQPSEFMKIPLILSLRTISLKNYSNIKTFIICFILTLIPSILVFLEPDTGAVLIYILIFLAFTFMKKYNKWFYIISIVIIITLASSFLYLYFQKRELFISLFGSSLFYRMDRITNFINKDGYQRNQAISSLKSSKLFGRGTLIYFPESATDFAFTFLVSQIGIVPSIIYLIIYALFILNIKGNKQSDKYIKISLITILTFQLIINVLMNLGLFPIIGITLPFLSYGGSSLLSYMILISLTLKKVSDDTYL
ncbi:MAG: FtsW/RodA/SpoVE family cell cycle protein [bacterium]|nr:FtsW/RodA/SpoVE family cell cycle protein [bacterium]